MVVLVANLLIFLFFCLSFTPDWTSIRPLGPSTCNVTEEGKAGWGWPAEVWVGLSENYWKLWCFQSSCFEAENSVTQLHIWQWRWLAEYELNRLMLAMLYLSLILAIIILVIIIIIIIIIIVIIGKIWVEETDVGNALPLFHHHPAEVLPSLSEKGCQNCDLRLTTFHIAIGYQLFFVEQAWFFLIFECGKRGQGCLSIHTLLPLIKNFFLPWQGTPA